MRIIIIGAGEVGFILAKHLSYEGHDIFVIEVNPERHTRVIESLDVQAILGSGTSYHVLQEAGVKDADLLVAVTTNDEINLLAAIMAKNYGVPRTIARVKNPEFLHPECPVSTEKSPIDLIIHPDSEAAKAAILLLKQSAATDVIEFAGGEIDLLGIQLDASCPVLHTPLSELSQQYSDQTFRTVAIQRKDITKIPKGDDIFVANDRVFIVTKRDSITDVIKMMGKENAQIEDIMILGGGQTGSLIAQELEKHCNVKIIESNTDRSYELAERLGKSLVIHGDGLDINLLAAEAIIDMDAFIAATGDDETNLISCLMAKHLKVPRIISLVNKTDYLPVLPTIGIDAYISKQMIAVNSIMKYIRRGQIVSVASIPGIAAEAIEMLPKPGSKITRKPLAQVNFPKNAILAAVLRGEQVFIPVGSTQIQAGDKVVLFVLPSAIRDVEKLFG